jgi:D-sedoheptulose 7-phosphate isomerase
MNDFAQYLKRELTTHAELIEAMEVACGASIEKASAVLLDCLLAGNKIMLCGNGGSAADAQHIATELSGRFLRERKALAALALTTDTSALTAIGNDYGFDSVFSRQVEALARPGDVLVAISTSGNSPNVIEAAKKAEALQCKVVGMTGAAKAALVQLSDPCVQIPSLYTPSIQEMHILVGHIMCGWIEQHIREE